MSSSTNAASSTCRGDDDSTCSHQSRRRILRRVSFNETTRVLIVPGLFQYPEKVKRDIFYSNDEYLDMKDDIRRSTRAARRGRCGPDDCTRGIEHLSSRSHIEERQSSQRAASDAVFTTQHRLRREGRADAVAIARASICRTRTAKDRARDFAIQDEEDAGKIYATCTRDARISSIFEALNVSTSEAPNAEMEDNLAKLDIRRNAA
jgi:hypothetical protein